MKKNIYAVATLLSFCIPSIVFAHVRWFADQDRAIEVPHENILLYATVWASVAIFIFVTGFFLEKYLQKAFHHRRHWSLKMQEWSTSVFGIIIGTFLLVASYNGFLFSLNLNHLGSFHDFLITLQALIGFSFLIGFGIRVSASALIALWVWSFFFIGPLHLLENLWVLGGALFALIHGRSHLRAKTFIGDKWFLPYKDYALPIVRVFVGVNLIILGFSEKILEPELGLSFLQDYHWNFMYNLGLHWYTDYLFVFSAGVVEVIFGVVFVLGIVTRINAFVLGIFFTIPLFILGPVELVGHMPHFTIVLVLILFGAGKKWRLANPY